MRQFSVRLMANESVGSLPIDNYVVSFRTSNTDERTQLLYRVSKDDPWTVVSEGVEIPGDAMLHLDIAYDGVSVSELKAHDGRLSYTLPGFMRNANASGNILAGQDIVGTVVVNNGVAVITFKPEFLENQESNTLLGGTFFVESQLDYTYIARKILEAWRSAMLPLALILKEILLPNMVKLT